jgi:hypothetical protein
MVNYPSGIHVIWIYRFLVVEQSYINMQVNTPIVETPLEVNALALWSLVTNTHLIPVGTFVNYLHLNRRKVFPK